MAGDFIGLTDSKSSSKRIDGIGGRKPRPIGETSIFYNEALDGQPREDDLFAVRVLGRTAQIEGLKDIIKSQVAGTDFKVVPDVPDSEDREPTEQEIQAAENIEEFFKGNFNRNDTSLDALHGKLLDDILDMNSGVLELVPDDSGFLQSIIPRDGLTFTINEKQNGLLPEPDSDEAAYYQFSLASHAQQFFRSDREGIDVRELREAIYNSPFSRIFNREQKEFSRDQIVWFSEPQNEKNYTVYGRGRTQKVKRMAENMINGDLHRNRFFLDNEYHKGFMKLPSDFSQEQAKELKKRFSQSAGNEHEMQIVGAEDAEWVPIDPEPEKMQFLESQKWYTKEVSRIFGLNDVAKGVLENANKGISDNAKEQLFRRVTSPLLTMFENRWNNQVLPHMEEYQAVDGNVMVMYEAENRFLEKMENEIIDTELESGTLTLNEARERKGKQPFGELGDAPKTAFDEYARNNPSYVIEQLTDLEDVPSGDGGGNPPGGLFGSSFSNNDKEDGENEEKNGSREPVKINSYSDAFKHKDEVLEHTKDALRNETGFNDVPGIVSHKENMKEDVAEVFDSINLDNALNENFPDESQDNQLLVDADSIVESFSLRERLASVIESNNLGALEMSAEHHEQDIEKETEKRVNLPEESKIEISFDVMDTFTADLIRNEALTSATGIESSIKDRLKKEILEGAEKGEGIDQITDRITDIKQSFKKDHAELVARTETLQSSRKGSQALAESTDLVAGKEWIATDDSRTREWHDKMDGKVVEKDGVFTVPKVGSDEQPSDYPRTARVVGEDQPFNCFDNKTEVLTEDGWKKFQKLDGEKVCTVDTETEKLEYQKPTNHIEKSVDKIMRYDGESISIAATPEHDMVVRQHGDLKKKQLGDIKENISTQVPIPNRTKGINQKSPEVYTIDAVKGEYEYQDKLYEEQWSEKQIDIEDWAAFLGIYLAEGFTRSSSNSYSTRISATKPKQRGKVMELLDRMGYDYSAPDDVVIVENKQLAMETENLSKGASDKIVPDYVFQWGADTINEFLDWYTLGDGNITEYGSRRIWTTSEVMADQLQQLFILTGKDASIIEQERDKMNVLGEECNAKNLYCVQERKSEHKSIDQRYNEIEKTEYDGKVRCVEVPNGTLVVRRNNKTMIAGNCRCAQAPVLSEDMPDDLNQLSEMPNVKVDLGMSKRQKEIWEKHSREDEDSFEQFWNRVTDEMSKTEISKKFEMSKTTVYNWME